MLRHTAGLDVGECKVGVQAIPSTKLLMGCWHGDTREWPALCTPVHDPCVGMHAMPAQRLAHGLHVHSSWVDGSMRAGNNVRGRQHTHEITTK